MTAATSGSETQRETAFLRALLADHEDHATRLVYADWLEERGDLRGEFIQLGYALDNPVRHREWRWMRSRRNSLRPYIAVRWHILIGRALWHEVFSGVVTRLRNNLAYVDLGGLEGAIDAEAFSSRPVRAADVYAIGDKVDVTVMGISASAPGVWLSLPQSWQRLWEDVFDKYPVGSRHTRIIRNVTCFGLFIELEPGLEGLVYIPEAARMRPPRQVRELFQKGEVVEVLVLEIDWHRRRIALGVVDPRSGIVCWGVVPP